VSGRCSGESFQVAGLWPAAVGAWLKVERTGTVALAVASDDAATRKTAAGMIDPLDGKLEAIAALCQEFGVLRLDVFGSTAKGTFDPETSDLDFVASFANRKNLDYADRYFDFVEALEALFGRQVDLITEQSIKNPYFREEVEETRRRVYVAPGESAAA
jgi:uncharacterized protein